MRWGLHAVHCAPYAEECCGRDAEARRVCRRPCTELDASSSLGRTQDAERWAPNAGRGTRMRWGLHAVHCAPYAEECCGRDAGARRVCRRSCTELDPSSSLGGTLGRGGFAGSLVLNSTLPAHWWGRWARNVTGNFQRYSVIPCALSRVRVQPVPRSALSDLAFSPQRCRVQPSAVPRSALGASTSFAPSNGKDVVGQSVERTWRNSCMR